MKLTQEVIDKIQEAMNHTKMNGDKVECVENRMVIFDSNLKHEGVSCTDQQRKVVINFNYER